MCSCPLESELRHRHRSAMAAKRLLALWVILCVPLEAKATSLGATQNPEDAVSVALKQNDEFYEHKGHICKKCPAGHYVFQHCKSSGTEGVCHPCENNTFSKYLNDFERCLPCTECRPLDEVVLQPCTTTSDTQCACKSGTFCSPSLPCETCHTCTTRCPDGETMVQPCTPESDMQCVKAPGPADATSQTPAAGSSGHILLILGILACVALVVAVAVGICKCRTKDSRKGSVTSVWDSKIFRRLRRKCTRRPQEVEVLWDVQVNQRIQSSSLEHVNSNARESETTPLQTTGSSEEVQVSTEQRRYLVPANGKDQMTALRLSFDIFIKEVPLKDWKRFMRALGLLDNDIDAIALMHVGDMKEQHFQMLRTWHDMNGKGASLDSLLEALCNMDLKGIEDKIRAALITQGLYVLEE
ncbi:tumor necrosis factor receptor superfamily member 10A-like [Podarcis lilfordi]|uniref:Tumor necrosis factor receptor superfamily member 10A-like n=1 Tax=Podarcis lilfordi TaxID=74358 RepID=A0AA35LG84_9SAUR|nr:tumor necrosis factor receptor superfamily member 10A-like [Podarcis lilfordi]